MSRRGARRVRVRPVLGYLTGAVTATGTTPPAVTLTGRAVGAYEFNIQITTGGALATAIFKWSQDNGQTFITNVTTAATVALGSTGITANFPAGTYTSDNVYTAPTVQL